MRTTLTLDDDLAARLSDMAHRSRRPFKEVVNSTIRQGLGLAEKGVAVKPFRVKGHPLGLRPGLDDRRLNQLVDELEADSAAARLGKRR